MNKVVLIGNVGKDPEVKETSSVKVATFSVATGRKKNGEEITDWHNIVCFDKTAEVVGTYLKKGHKVAVEGSIQYEKYTDKDGNERTATKIVATNIELLTPRDNAGERPAASAQSPAPARQSTPSRPASAPVQPEQDDDLPF